MRVTAKIRQPKTAIMTGEARRTSNVGKKYEARQRGKTILTMPRRKAETPATIPNVKACLEKSHPKRESMPFIDRMKETMKAIERTKVRIIKTREGTKLERNSRQIAVSAEKSVFASSYMRFE